MTRKMLLMIPVATLLSATSLAAQSAEIDVNGGSHIH